MLSLVAAADGVTVGLGAISAPQKGVRKFVVSAIGACARPSIIARARFRTSVLSRSTSLTSNIGLGGFERRFSFCIMKTPVMTSAATQVRRIATVPKRIIFFNSIFGRFIGFPAAYRFSGQLH